MASEARTLRLVIMFNFQNAECQDILKNSFSTCFVWVQNVIFFFKGRK